MTCKANKPACYQIITGDHRDNVMELRYKLEMIPIATSVMKCIPAGRSWEARYGNSSIPSVCVIAAQYI